ncbi:hypothetical protein LpeD_119 [Lactobacillus phage LpeD]|uniref:Uncharacterized protein n=1 Tax=Lactobacillus phage LpeD TaxID=2041210 RepID=A0A291I9L1_9CAUD|nr:hypothetical protein HWB32_gp074 [Lactobacillus phage LpeD]ATG86381.1 hypothetical protein LpeD_119 [Lactobacillus phage LpeD]
MKNDKIIKVVLALVAGLTLSLVAFKPSSVDASQRPNYAYTLTRTKQHAVKLVNTGKTENMYRVTIKQRDHSKWYYMALNARQSWVVNQSGKYSVTVRRVSKSDEKRNADPRNHFTPQGISNTQRTIWNR